MTEYDVACNDGCCIECGCKIVDPEGCHACETLIVNGDDQYDDSDAPVDCPCNIELAQELLKRKPCDHDAHLEQMIEADYFEHGYMERHSWDQTGTACK